MKKVLVVFGVLLMSAMASARSITCYDRANGQMVASVVDDLGWIVSGSIFLNGTHTEYLDDIHAKISKGDGSAYTYFYGEYVLVKYINQNDETIDLVAINSGRKNEFIGFLNYSNGSESHNIQTMKIKCIE